MKRSILHNDLALDRILRIQHKGICMWCPLVPSTSAIFFLLPALRATGIKHNALCVRTAEEALCVFVLKALFHLSRTIRIQKQATSTVAKLTGAAISINYLPCRALASQGPCVEPSGQQSTPCRGSTTVQRPVLTGKKEGGGETFQAGAPYCLVPPYTSPRWLPPKAV